MNPCAECGENVDPDAFDTHVYTYGDWQRGLVTYEQIDKDVHLRCCRVCKQESA